MMAEANKIFIGVVMMLFFFQTKRNRLFLQLVKAFPKELAADVKTVCNALTVKSDAYSGTSYSDEKTEWRLLSGEKIAIPYRIYVSDKLFFLSKLTA